MRKGQALQLRRGEADQLGTVKGTTYGGGFRPLANDPGVRITLHEETTRHQQLAYAGAGAGQHPPTCGGGTLGTRTTPSTIVYPVQHTKPAKPADLITSCLDRPTLHRLVSRARPGTIIANACAAFPSRVVQDRSGCCASTL